MRGQNFSLSVTDSRSYKAEACRHRNTSLCFRFTWHLWHLIIGSLDTQTVHLNLDSKPVDKNMVNILLYTLSNLTYISSLQHSSIPQA